jgi:hypothetical protein
MCSIGVADYYCTTRERNCSGCSKVAGSIANHKEGHHTVSMEVDKEDLYTVSIAVGNEGLYTVRIVVDNIIHHIEDGTAHHTVHLTGSHSVHHADIHWQTQCLHTGHQAESGFLWHHQPYWEKAHLNNREAVDVIVVVDKGNIIADMGNVAAVADLDSVVADMGSVVAVADMDSVVTDEGNAVGIADFILPDIHAGILVETEDYGPDLFIGIDHSIEGTVGTVNPLNHHSQTRSCR